MHKKIITLFVAFLLFSEPVSAQGVDIVAPDTLAGVGAHIELLGNLDGETLIVVIPPVGSEILVPVEENEGGVGGFVEGADLEVAGIYEVLLEIDGLPTDHSTTFEVLADTVDIQNSTIQVHRNYMENDGVDTVEVDVILRDRFDNVIPRRPVRLISSNPDDFVSEVTAETDESGKQTFAVQTKGGTSVLRAIDLISGKVLADEATIGGGAFLAGAGGTSQNALPPSIIRSGNYVPETYASPFVGNLLGNSTVNQAPSTGLIPANEERQLYKSADANGVSQVEFLQGRTNAGTQSPSNVGMQPPSQLAANLLEGRRLYGQVSSFGEVDRFILEIVPEIEANFDEDLGITAVDENGRVVENYVGTVCLSSTDPNAILPGFGEITFRGSDLGQKKTTQGTRFSTPGQQILVVEDCNDPDARGVAFVNVTGGASNGEQGIILVSEPEDGSLINTPSVIMRGKGPPFVDLVIMGGEVDVFGETLADGSFSVEVPLDTSKVDHTLRVVDNSGRFDSGNISLKTDVSAPEILRFSFTPPNPKEEEEMLVVVGIKEAGPGLENVTLTIGETEYDLEEIQSDREDEDYAYQALISLDTFGDYQPVVTATDLAGNTGEALTTIDVRQRGLPKVENLQSEPDVNFVRLTWDELADEEVDAYRIYVYEDPREPYLYTIDTDRPVSSVDVSNLIPSETYFFRVKALGGERESEEFSNLVQGATLGMNLEVEEGDGQLTLTWTGLPDTVPLSRYILEYGIDPQNMSETRPDIAGESTRYVIRDLINEVTYYIKLTPVSVTGEKLEDLAAEAQGTPNSAVMGFVPGFGDPIPDDLIADLRPGAPTVPPIDTVAPPERQPDTGTPWSRWWIVVTLATFGGVYLWQRRRSHADTEEFFRGTPSMDIHMHDNDSIIIPYR